jgi:aspartate/methionine/tyrosine aminotransferase
MSMLPRIEYLDFAGRWFSQVRYDLATSGIAPIAASALGDARPDDVRERETFKRAVAERYSVAESEVVACLGAAGALFALYTALLGPGTRALVERPSYEPLWRVAQGTGAQVDFFERRVDDCFRLDVERVTAALHPDTKLVAITNPHNPSGVLSTSDELATLAVALRARAVCLLVDEAYLELAQPRSTARSISENVVTCSSATKCWGVPWARAGWLLLSPELVSAVAHVERHVCALAPPACWAWGALAVRQADELLERAHALQLGKRELVEAFLQRHAAELRWVPPCGASVYGWVRAAGGGDLSSILERAIERQGVLVALGRFFGDVSSFRLSWTAPADTVSEGLERLGRVLA